MDFRSDYDFCLIPDKMAAECDTLEVRIQCRNAVQPVKVKFYCDGTLWGETFTQINGNFQTASFRQKLTGLAGNRTIKAVLSDGISEYQAERTLKITAAHSGIFQGGFVMLGAPADRKPCDPFRDAVMNLSDQDWQQQIDGWHQLGMQTLVLYDTIFPASLRDGKYQAYYNSRLLPKAPVRAEDPIAAILSAAEKNGQQVFMGMCAWRGASESLQMELLSELYERYCHYKSFYGWYASSEFSTANVCFDSAAEYFGNIRSRIRNFSWVMPLLTSPYQPAIHLDFKGGLPFSSPEFAEMLHNGVHPHFGKLLTECADRPDIIMPQDGAGRRYPYPRHRDLIEFNFRSYAAFKEIAEAAKIHLWANVESFDFSDENLLVPRFDNGGFDGEKGLVQQIDSAYRDVEKVLTFSLPGFFASDSTGIAIGGEAAKEQARNYQIYMQKPLPACRNIAKNCAYTITPAPSSLLPDRKPGKLTDGLISGGYAVDVDSDRLIGYISNKADSNLSVEIVLDLGKLQEFQIVQLAGSVRNIRGRADSMQVEYRSTTNEPYQQFGSTSTYTLGFLKVKRPAPVCGRFIRITLAKHFSTNINESWLDSWLLLDELEVLQTV